MSPNNAEIILNTVAVLFVLEIDDQLYTVTVPAAMRRVFEALPPLKVGVDAELQGGGCSSLGGFATACSVMIGQWLNMGAIAGMTAAVLTMQC